MFDIFFTFFKIGLFTFGGGYAMISLIEREIIDHKHWIDNDELLEIISVSQMSPGPIAINVAIFIGKKYKGIPGALLATIGSVLPSLVIITLISIFFSKNFINPNVQHLLLGIRAGIVALILSTVIKLSKSVPKNLISLTTFFISLIGLLLFNISPIFLILFFGISSIAVSFFVGGK